MSNSSCIKINIMQQLSKGATLQGGKYIIERVLGQGGFGITYLATHSILEKHVAIKEFFPKDFCERNGNTSHITLGNANTSELVAKLKEKFLKEAKNISKLNHPNIVAIHDIFEENGTAYYLMDYIDGVSLNERIKSSGAMPEADALSYIKAIRSAIAYMHTKSMNHLDIKPANIMLRESDDTPILIDFGLAKQYDSTGEQTSTTPVGISHGYAPIEQYRPGGVSTFTPQTDVYALGATLFALLSGSTPPHYSDILEDGLPELPSSVSQETVVAIEKAMETKKAKRPSTIEEFLAMLPNEGQETTHKVEVPVAKPTLPTKSKAEDVPIPEKQAINVPKEEPTPKFVEETVILNVPLINYTAPKKEDQIIDDTPRANSNSETLQYLDLGLSVKWATKLSGIAKPVMNDDVYEFQLENGDTVRPQSFITEHHLPSTKQFEELIERCSWTTFQEGGIHGYKIIGPNGNILMMPLGVLNRYLSAECLKPNSLYYYFLYLGEYTHTLAKGVPTEANIWTVRQ